MVDALHLLLSSAAASAAAPAPIIDIRLPPGAASNVVRDAVEKASQAIEVATQEAQQQAGATQRITRRRQHGHAGQGASRRLPAIMTRCNQRHAPDFVLSSPKL